MKIFFTPVAFAAVILSTVSLVSCTKTHNPTPVVDSLKIGLIAYYPFNYDSAVDSSGNHNDGTIYNITSVPDRFGKANSAYYFNGENSYIVVKDNQALRLANTDYTINSWVNLQEYDSSYGSVIVDKRGLGSSNGWLDGIAGYADLTNSVGAYGIITYLVSGGTDPGAIGKKVVPLNGWHMITVSFNNQSKQISLYVDGVLDTVTDNMPTPSNSTATDMYIGTDSQDFLNGNITSYFLKGNLDDIRIYNRQLKISDIQKLFNLTY